MSSNLWAKYAQSGPPIGSGEHSTVRILIRKCDGKRFACKSTRILCGSKEESGSSMRRVRVEAECLIKMSSHTGVVNYEELVMDTDSWHLIIELCDCSLADLIRRRGKLPEVEAALLLHKLASTLSDLHSAGIMHRDVKPDNILISGSSLKYADFGIARCLSASAIQTRKQLSDRVGTPRYAAPEVVCGSYWLQADVWSLGVTLYQMLAGGDKVFGGYSTDELLSELKVCGVASETCLEWDGISEGARDLIQRMMDKNPYKRPKPADVLVHPWLLQQVAAARGGGGDG